jgi:hypothetical protein
LYLLTTSYEFSRIQSWGCHGAELTKVHIIGIHHVVQGCYNIKEHEVFACRSSFVIENNDNYTNSHESHWPQ